VGSFRIFRKQVIRLSSIEAVDRDNRLETTYNVVSMFGERADVAIASTLGLVRPLGRPTARIFQAPFGSSLRP